MKNEYVPHDFLSNWILLETVDRQMKGENVGIEEIARERGVNDPIRLDQYRADLNEYYSRQKQQSASDLIRLI